MLDKVKLDLVYLKIKSLNEKVSFHTNYVTSWDTANVHLLMKSLWSMILRQLKISNLVLTHDCE